MVFEFEYGWRRWRLSCRSKRRQGRDLHADRCSNMVDRSAVMAARTLRLVVVLLLFLTSATCGGAPTSPSRAEYIGTWVGSMRHPTAGVGGLTVMIDEGQDGV